MGCFEKDPWSSLQRARVKECFSLVRGMLVVMTRAENLDKSGDVKVLKRDIPWETYMTAKLINSRGLQLLRRYDHRPDSVQAALLDEVNCGSKPPLSRYFPCRFDVDFWLSHLNLGLKWALSSFA